jgi:hypothetical protein
MLLEDVGSHQAISLPNLQGFEMPPDPRVYRGPRGETQRDFYGSFYVPPEKQYVEDLL